MGTCAEAGETKRAQIVANKLIRHKALERLKVCRGTVFGHATLGTTKALNVQMETNMAQVSLSMNSSLSCERIRMRLIPLIPEPTGFTCISPHCCHHSAHLSLALR